MEKIKPLDLGALAINENDTDGALSFLIVEDKDNTYGFIISPNTLQKIFQQRISEFLFEEKIFHLRKAGSLTNSQNLERISAANANSRSSESEGYKVEWKNINLKN